MKVGVLTSSRADYSIYLPLLKALQSDSYFELSVIAFGTHLSQEFGYTVNQIKQDGFTVDYEQNTTPLGYEPNDIATSIGNTVNLFSNYWTNSNYDIVFALGDRYEMYAACTATIPFNIPLAHIHGGEITLGAIDDVFRNCISLMAKVHFPVAKVYKERLVQLLGNNSNIYNVGSLSYDTLNEVELYDIPKFLQIFNIDLTLKSILITYHPETVNYNDNEKHIKELLAALHTLNHYQLIITMPNADTMGNLIRSSIINFALTRPNVKCIESFGTIGYLTCMKYCSFLLGNSSSGFAEAAFFPKTVVNIGDRQKGRLSTPNIIHTITSKDAILSAITQAENMHQIQAIDTYGNGTAATQIINILKNELATAHH